MGSVVIKVLNKQVEEKNRDFKGVSYHGSLYSYLVGINDVDHKPVNIYIIIRRDGYIIHVAWMHAEILWHEELSIALIQDNEIALYSSIPFKGVNYTFIFT